MTPAPRTGRLSMLLALALLAGAAALGVVLGLHGSAKAGHADGLRGGHVPAALARSAAPRIHLRDARGRVVDTRALAGRPYAVTFLYTHCRDVCPLVGRELSEALSQLGDRADDVAVLGVSVDPAGDTPAAARRWERREQLPASFHYLLGSRRQLQPTWHGYFVAPQDAAADESVHTASVWLVDGHGHRRAKYSAGAPIDPRDVAHDLARLLDEGAAS